MRSFYSILVVAVLVILGLGQAGRASTQATGSHNIGDSLPFNPGYTVSSTDLINGESPAASSSDFGTVPVLTDGAYPTFSDASVFAIAGPDLNTPDYLTYSLGSDPRGYTLSSIDTYGGWIDNGRADQGYTVAYSTTSSAGPFTTIAVVDYAYGPPNDPSASQVIINDSLGAPLAMGATYLKFTFDQTVSNGYEGYAELDVFGVATPEPASLGLILTGGLMLLKRRRRA